MDKLSRKTALSFIIAILVLGAFSTFSAPRVKAQAPQPATVTSINWYLAPADNGLGAFVGDLVVVGEVQNTGTNQLHSVLVIIEAFNSSGGIVSGSSYPVQLDTDLLPGQKVPFYEDLTAFASGLTSNWETSVTNITAWTEYPVTGNRTVYSGLTTSSLTGVNNGGTYTVKGIIGNTGAQTVGRVYALVTFYNATGDVVAMNSTNFLDPSGSLSPGNSLLFTSTPVDNTAALSSKIANYSVLVEYQPYSVPATVTPTPAVTTPPTSPSTNATSTPNKTAGLQINSLVIYAIVIVVVVVVVALAALLLLKNRRGSGRSSKPFPPPPPPPQ